jgi:hypothetical protein
MFRKWLKPWLVVSALVALGSCGPELDGPGASPAPPPVPASGDIVDGTAHMGPLELGGAVQTRFTAEAQHLSFRFQVRAGARVKLEVAQLGSSTSLDTGLFVYGPRRADGGYGATVLARDDDAGHGQLSRVASLTLAQEGDYLAVVSTGSGAGKQFRLKLDCLNGTCAPVVDPALYASCDAGVASLIEACVEETMEEYGASRAEAYSTCTGLDDAHAFYMSVCNSASAPAWCPGGETQYSQRMWPVCQDHYLHTYGLSPLTLSPLPLPARLAGGVTDVNARCGGACTGALETFTIPWTSTALPRLDKVVEAYLAPGQHGGYSYLGEMTFSQLAQDVAPHWSALPHDLLAELGHATPTVRVAHYTRQGVGERRDLYILLFSRSLRVAVLHTTRADG